MRMSLKIRLTRDEFLSGFRKGDKLIPIITATVLLSDKEWKGPRDLYDMLDVKDDTLLRFIPNYPINLIEPAKMSDSDFEKFNTELGLAMKVLKYQKAGAVKVIKATNHEMIERETAVILDRVAKLDLEFDEKEDQVDMCKAMEDNNRKMEVTGAIKGMRRLGASEDSIITDVMEMYSVTREYVLAILKEQAA